MHVCRRPCRSAVREQRSAALTPEQAAEYHAASSQLYLLLKQEVDAQLQKFEAYALETCLHVPAGLLVQPVSGRGSSAGRFSSWWVCGCHFCSRPRSSSCIPQVRCMQ